MAYGYATVADPLTPEKLKATYIRSMDTKLWLIEMGQWLPRLHLWENQSEIHPKMRNEQVQTESEKL